MGRQYHSVRHRGDLLGIAFLAYAPGRGEPSPLPHCRRCTILLSAVPIYADGVPMTTDRLLGLMALAIGGALAWFLFEPVMLATAAHGVNDQVGHDLCEWAGLLNLTDAEMGNYTPEQAAKDTAQWLTEQGTRLIDFDGEEMDMARYIERYLSQN
jgi:hypothetical protein